MHPSNYLPRANRSFIHFCGYFSVVAGFLEVVVGLQLTTAFPIVTEMLYVGTDLCLLLGFLGWYLYEQEEVGAIGLIGFLIAFWGMAFIAGPSTQIFDVTAYSIGVPIIGVGLLIMCLTSLRSGSIPKPTLMLFLVSLVLGSVAPFMPFLVSPFTCSNIVYGIAFLGLGYHLIRAVP